MSYVSEHNNAATRLLVKLRNARDLTEASCLKHPKEDLEGLPPEAAAQITAAVEEALTDLRKAIDIVTTVARDQVE